MSNQERRFFTAEVRADPASDEGKASRIIGYGAVFNQRSENLGGFREIIMPGAFDDVMDQDIRGLFNHDSNYVLGRTGAGTMTLSVDETGFKYDITAPETQTIRDLVLTPMERGDINQSSFTFIIGRDGDRWYEDEEGVIVREIHRFKRVFDVGPVSIPAYPDTTAASRSLQQFKQEGQLQHALTQKRARERLLRLISA